MLQPSQAPLVYGHALYTVVPYCVHQGSCAPYGPSCIVAFAVVVCTPDANSQLRVSVTLMLLPLHRVSVCASDAASSAECLICSGGVAHAIFPFPPLHNA